MEYSEELASSAPPNSCCEYTNLKGEQKSVLQCLCACDEVDETFDAMVNGKEIKEMAKDYIFVTNMNTKENGKMTKCPVKYIKVIFIT